jgi:hypothetical protein
MDPAGLGAWRNPRALGGICGGGKYSLSKSGRLTASRWQFISLGINLVLPQLGFLKD